MSLLVVAQRVNKQLQEAAEPPTQLGCLSRICLILLNMPPPKTAIYEAVVWDPFKIIGRETADFLASKSSGLLWASV